MPAAILAVALVIVVASLAASARATSPRFVRRLIAERRIAVAKLGKHVRLDSSDLDVLIGAGRVEVTNAAAAPFYP